MNIPRDSIHIKYEFGVPWLKLLYHDAKGGKYFISESMLNFIDTEERFSLLGKITEVFKIDGYYEFLLQYPELEGYNRWKQSVYILNSTEEDVGYQADPSDITWSETYWKGLARSSNTEDAYIDGSIGVFYYWYTVAAKSTYQSYTNSFPGPSTSFGDGPIVSQVCLWIRIPGKILGDFFSVRVRKYDTLIFLAQLIITFFTKI